MDPVIKLEIPRDNIEAMLNYILLVGGLGCLFLGISLSYLGVCGIILVMTLIPFGIFNLALYFHEWVFWRQPHYITLDMQKERLSVVERGMMISREKDYPLADITRVDFIIATEKYHSTEKNRVGKLDALLLYKGDKCIAGFDHPQFGDGIEDVERLLRTAGMPFKEVEEDLFIKESLKEIGEMVDEPGLSETKTK